MFPIIQIKLETLFKNRMKYKMYLPELIFRAYIIFDLLEIHKILSSIIYIMIFYSQCTDKYFQTFKKMLYNLVRRDYIKIFLIIL